MTTKYFIDSSSNYLGGFHGAQPPEGAIEVPTAPVHAKDKWNGTAWVSDAAVEKSKINAPILAQIAVLDLKRIRPLAEGDTAYLAQLNEQIKALRAQLK